MSPDPVIQVLPDHIINKIAAGEVVDRPASVVKELMENALDAGATSIDVEIVDGGLKLIAISDDGCGMDRDNALLSLERHATSKIRQVDDIERVETLGFRGEALAAIASVSRFTLLTRRHQDLTGTTIRVNGGRMEDVSEAGCPPGTRFEIRHLFFNVPARRKFLKAPATELNHVRQVFMLYALGRPDVALRLVVDEREIYRLDGDSRLDDRIRQLYGPEFLRDLLPVDWTDGSWGLRGLISGPRLNRADRQEQYIFINGRPASAPVLGFAIGEAYQPHLPRGRHPVLFLFVDLPADEVDVNVHPTKKEVRFRHATRLRDAVVSALRVVLTGKPVETPDNLSAPDHAADRGPLPVKEFLRVPDLPVLPAFSYPKKTDTPAAGSATDTDHEHQPSTVAQDTRAPWQWCRILGQIANYFVVLETDEGMILMDPQAAHERVLYDRMMNAALRRSIDRQGLLPPETVNLPPARAGIIRRHISLLRDLGFGLSEFGGDTFLVDHLPALLGPLSAAEVLNDVAADLEASGRTLGGEAVLREHILQAATRLSVRTTMQLSREDLETLINDLAGTELPYTSPRGRATLIFTSIQELKKKFGRD
ncbi:MAG TPA: DNA mismatch repair endonuclease MutL [Kiritimatiellia bacterium]|nr:DNA mismatch repair endonuclease MutL [Kiritimatiellia bacterium]HMO98629.1 DNA mismatch repair endonuclease MutL [Kiritimatiellia bacterium]